MPYLPLGERVRRGYQHTGEFWIVPRVPCILDDHEFSVRPSTMEGPCVPQWSLEVEASVHEDPGDAHQDVGVPQKDAVLEEQVVPNEVGHEPGEREGEGRIGEPFVETVGWGPRASPTPTRTTRALHGDRPRGPDR
jgi:hypothetical protein